MLFEKMKESTVSQASGLELLKRQYIDSAILNSKASADGDCETANEQAKILNEIFHEMDTSIEGKNILVELLNYEDIRVRLIAAIDLLRIHHEVEKAEKTLVSTAFLDETGIRIDLKLIVMAAQIQLLYWEKKGYVI